MLDYILEYLKTSLCVTGLYLGGCIIALFIVSNFLYYTNTTESINTLINHTSIYNPYLNDEEESDTEEETDESDVLDVIEDEVPIDKIEIFLENTNNLIESYEDIKNPTYSDILQNSFAKTTLKDRLEQIIKTNNPVLVDDIFYPTPCASTLELKIWKQLINNIMQIENEYIN